MSLENGSMGDDSFESTGTPPDRMAALAICTCLPNSHPFHERHVSLHEPVKIGRSVARARPSPNNAIFDCKVLSRNHALLWYENGKFFLEDTKSSNGTFLNNQRLGKGTEDSAPREVFSGDTVQFGVDVTENSRRGSVPVTHGCIIASLQLFHPDGREARPSHSSPFLNSPSGGTSVQSQEIYQLAQYLQEALHREQMLENKLATLQRLVQNTQEASDTGWQALIDEDRLLSRLEVLENQLQAYSNNQTEDNLRKELVALQEDKHNYETTAKESLRKVLQEKLDAVRKLSELERSLSNTEDECTHLKEMCESSQKELQQLAEKHEQQLKEMEELQEKLQEAEKQHAIEQEKNESEKTELQAKLDEKIKEESILSAKVESLQADNDFTKEQLTNMKGRIEAMKEKGEETSFPEVESQGTQVDLVNMMDLQLLQQNSDESSDDEEKPAEELKASTSQPVPSVKTSARVKLKETQEQIEYYKGQLKDSEQRLEESKEQVASLQTQLENARSEVVSYMAKISSLEEKLKLSDIQMNQVVENAVADLKIQLTESKKQADNSNELVQKLKDDIVSLEGQLSHVENGEEAEQTMTRSPNTHDLTNSNSIPNHLDDVISSNHLKEEVENLKVLLQESKDEQRKGEAEVNRLKSELEEVSLHHKKCADEALLLQSQLNDAQKQAKDRTDYVNTLQDQLNKAELSTKDVKQQILVLREQLQEAEQAAKQSRNETEQLKMRVQSLQEELEENRRKDELLTRETAATTAASTHHEMQKQAARNKAEFTSLKEECANFRRRIQDIETEMKASRRENHQLQSEYAKLQDSYYELEALKEKLENKEETWKINLTDAQKESNKTKAELVEANNEISVLKDKCSQFNQEIGQLRRELEEMSEDYNNLAYRSKTLSACSMIPLLMLIFALLLAMYPTLATITATSAPEET